MPDEQTEISEAELRAWRADPSDLVRRVLPPYMRPGVPGQRPATTLAQRMELPNTEGLCPELLEMFSWTMRDDPLPFKLRRGYNYAGPVVKRMKVVSPEPSIPEESVPSKADGGNAGVEPLSDGNFFSSPSYRHFLPRLTTTFSCYLDDAKSIDRQTVGGNDDTSDGSDNGASIKHSIGHTFTLRFGEEAITPLKELLPSQPIHLESPEGTMTYRIRYVKGRDKWVVYYTACVKHIKKGKRKQLGSYSSHDEVHTSETL